LNSANLVKRVAALISPLLPERSTILIGLSGGVDSVLLLHLLHLLAPRFSWQISALHVHHGISPNADAWAVFCAELCARYHIPLHIEHVDIAPLRAQGIEAAARRLRHAAFVTQSCDFVALAHHADDQAETLLLQLLRGAGVRGASAMPVLSNVEGPVLSPVEGPVLNVSKRAEDGVGQHRVVRPLLHITRGEIVAYAESQGLQWIEDESNADDSYPRNFLRHRLLPLMDQKFPAYRETLARSTQHFAEASGLLDELAQQDAAQAMRGSTLEVAALQGLSLPRAKNLLRYFLHHLGTPMPQAVQLDDMLHQLCDARADAAVCISYGGHQVRRYQGLVHVMPELAEFDTQQRLVWQGEVQLDWPALGSRICFSESVGKGISLSKLQGAPVTLRLRSGGEALRPYPNGATRTLKNLLQEHRVPPWQRARLPLLYCGEELVSVAGLVTAAEYQVMADDENGLVMEWTPTS